MGGMYCWLYYTEGWTVLFAILNCWRDCNSGWIANFLSLYLFVLLQISQFPFIFKMIREILMGFILGWLFGLLFDHKAGLTVMKILKSPHLSLGRRHIWKISIRYLWHFQDISMTYLGHIRNISVTYLGQIWDISKIFLGYIYLGQCETWNISLAILTQKMTWFVLGVIGFIQNFTGLILNVT